MPFMATDSLFILSLLTPVESQSISRDLEQELETEDKSSGEKAGGGRAGWGGKDGGQHRDLFALPGGLWPHAGRRMLVGSWRDLPCDYGPYQLI